MLKSRVFGLFLLKKDDTCYNMFMFRSGAATAVLIGATVTTGLILTCSYDFADDSVDDLAITVPVSCTLSGTGMNTHNATINNGQYNSAIGQTTIKALCNDSEGFAIYTIGYTDNTDGVNVLTSSTLGSTFDITTGTQTSGANSKWAMKLTADSGQTYPIVIENSFNNFHNVPDDYTLAASRASGTDIGSSAVGSTITTTYQAYISPTQAAGTYTGQVKYVLVHPSSASVIWTLNYDANGGTNAPTAGRGFVTGDSYDFTITSSEPTRSGYIFVGWSESSSATTADYEAGDTYTVTTASSTLYAVWIEDRSVSLVYNGNSADAGVMTIEDQYYYDYYTDIEYTDWVPLLSSNYSRSGYGFAGWSTTQLNPNSNSFATDFAALATDDGIYGPSQIISVDANFIMSADNNDIVTLYAVWVPVARTSGNVELTFQTTNLFATTLSDSTTLASKPVGYVTALKDVRDNQVYAITKVDDGSWWMIENLRLDLGTANITSANTNNPTVAFLSNITNVSSSDSWCQNEDANCINQVLYNSANIDYSVTADPDSWENGISSWYSYGVYYNWYTATAGNGDYDFVSYYGQDDYSDERFQYAPSTGGDICPIGWKLPLFKNNSSPWDMYPVVAGSAVSLVLNSFAGDTWGNSQTDAFVRFPFNFVDSGYWSGTSQYGRGPYDSLNGLNTRSTTPDIHTVQLQDSMNLNYSSTFGYLDGEHNETFITPVGRIDGYPVRCVAVP